MATLVGTIEVFDLLSSKIQSLCVGDNFQIFNARQAFPMTCDNGVFSGVYEFRNNGDYILINGTEFLRGCLFILGVDVTALETGNIKTYSEIEANYYLNNTSTINGATPTTLIQTTMTGKNFKIELNVTGGGSFTNKQYGYCIFSNNPK